MPECGHSLSHTHIHTQADGGVLIAPLASSIQAAEGGRDSKGLLLRFDLPPTAQCKAEVMILVKGAAALGPGTGRQRP